MHPLTKLLFEEGHFSGHRKPIEAEKVITTYLKGRAEWLKGQWMKDVDFTIELIDTAFELDEKCEHKWHAFDSNRQEYCSDCGKSIEPKPSLPSKIDKPIAGVDKWEHLFERQRKTINDLIDYLHSKEAREGE